MLNRRGRSEVGAICKQPLEDPRKCRSSIVPTVGSVTNRRTHCGAKITWTGLQWATHTSASKHGCAM